MAPKREDNRPLQLSQDEFTSMLAARSLCVQLIEAVANLYNIPDESIIYVLDPEQEWSTESQTVVVPIAEELELSTEVQGVHYFLEVFVAKEVLG